MTKDELHKRHDSACYYLEMTRYAHRLADYFSGCALYSDENHVYNPEDVALALREIKNYFDANPQVLKTS